MADKKYSIVLIISIIININTYLYSQDTTFLKVITTTDLHGSFLPYDLLENRDRSNSLAQVYSLVVSERAVANQELILLDNGDLLQGDPLIYYYNFVDTAGTHPLAQIMNFMKYDAATIGNHDIEAGHVVYDKLNRQFAFPWMGANIVNETNGIPYFQPYTILTRNNLKVAVLGLCTPAIPQWLPEELWSGLIFEDMVHTAEEWVGRIKEKYDPDILIGLFHSGAPRIDFPSGIPYMLEDASRAIARRIPGFDVVFSGHDHQRWNDTVVSPDGKITLVIGGGSNARNIAMAEIRIIICDTNRMMSKELKGSVLDVTKLPANAEFVEKFSLFNEPVKEYLSQPVATLHDTLFSRDALFGSAEFVNLIHHIQLHITGAGISFSAPLTFNAVIPAGVIQRKEMFKLYRFENQLYTMNLSGKEILDALEYSYGRWMNQMSVADDHLLNFVKDEKGEIIFNAYGQPQTATPFYNFESAAGIIYTVDVSKPTGNRINIQSLVNGSSFNLDTLYSVAINSYRGSGGGGHLIQGAGISQEELASRITWTSGQDLRSMITNWLQSHPFPLNTHETQWKVVPHSWYIRGRSKDFDLLFKR